MAHFALAAKDATLSPLQGTDMHRFLNRTIVLLLALGLAGCSLLYSYSNIDRYIRWSLDDYITWDDAQESRLRSSLATQLQWHKETQLPRYREWLQAIDRTLDADVEVAQLAAAAEQLQSFWQETMAHSEADISAQLASLSDRQVREMFDAIREQQADLKSEYDDLTRAELIKKRNRDMTRIMKYWLGTVDKKQIALINTWATRLPDGRTPWLDNRERWSDSFAQAMQNRHDPERFGSEIHALFVTPQEHWTAEFRKMSEQNRESTLQLLADLHNSRSPQQRDVERKRAAQWLDRLERLAVD
jgi:hypothetical protein